MKRFLWGLLAIWGSACAAPTVSQEIRARCAVVGVLASEVMFARQIDVPRAELEAAVADGSMPDGDARDLALAMVETAYDGWAVAPAPDRPRIAEEFATAWNLACLSANAPPPSQIRLRDPEDY